MGSSPNYRRSITNLFIFLSFFMGMIYLGLQAHQKTTESLVGEELLSNPSAYTVTDVRVGNDSTIEIEYADSSVQTIGAEYTRR